MDLTSEERAGAGMTASPSAQKHDDLARLSDGIVRIAHPLRIVLFGSFARQGTDAAHDIAGGRELAASDADVLIVSGHDPRVLATVLAEAGEQLGREVNVTAYTTDEFRARVAAGRPFLTGVLDGAKIWLLGDDAELRALLDYVEPASA